MRGSAERGKGGVQYVIRPDRLTADRFNINKADVSSIYYHTQ